MTIFIIFAVTCFLIISFATVGYLSDIVTELNAIATALNYFKAVSEDDIRNRRIDEYANNKYSSDGNAKNILKKLYDGKQV